MARSKYKVPQKRTAESEPTPAKRPSTSAATKKPVALTSWENPVDIMPRSKSKVPQKRTEESEPTPVKRPSISAATKKPVALTSQENPGPSPQTVQVDIMPRSKSKVPQKRNAESEPTPAKRPSTSAATRKPVALTSRENPGPSPQTVQGTPETRRKKRYRPGERALMEIRKYKKPTNCSSR